MAYRLTLNIGDKVVIKPEGKKEFIEGMIIQVGKHSLTCKKYNWVGVRTNNNNYYHMNFISDRDFRDSYSLKHLVIKKVS